MGNLVEDKLLSYADFAALTGTSELAVVAAVRDGSLLAIRKTMPDGTTESGIASFQALPEIRGEPLSRVLAALGFHHSDDDTMDSADAYSFLVARHELLGGLTPAEVLTGSARGAMTEEVCEFLTRPHAERVDFVVRVAKATANVLRSL